MTHLDQLWTDRHTEYPTAYRWIISGIATEKKWSKKAREREESNMELCRYCDG